MPVVIGSSYTGGCSDVTKTTSHSVYQTGEEEKRRGRDRPRTSDENQAIADGQ